MNEKKYQNMTESEKNELIAYTVAMQKLCLDSIEKLMKSHSFLLAVSGIKLIFLSLIFLILMFRWK